jgi:NAD(P)-dependent dehydrogenase (short-subunit alcohol dehydrogenase family)
VIGVARKEERLVAAAMGAGFEPRTADTLDRTSLDRVCADLASVDHLVVTAYGLPPWGPLAQLREEAVREAFDYKFLGYFRTVQAALPRIPKHGSITLVTGAVARIAMAGGSGPSAVNGAIHAWAFCLAKELAPIRVNCVSPGLTEMPAYDGMPAEARANMFREADAGHAPLPPPSTTKQGAARVAASPCRRRERPHLFRSRSSSSRTTCTCPTPPPALRASPTTWGRGSRSRSR